MTGDTNVLMANGTSTKLKDIRSGDMVATFDKGQLGVSKINNWKSNGFDSIYEVQTQSGTILRANERHPFLVMNEGVLEWTRLKNLKLGMLLVTLKDASDRQDLKSNQECVGLAKQTQVTIGKTLKRRIDQSATTVSGRMKNAAAESQPKQKGCATPVIQNNSRQQNQLQSKTGLGALKIGMALLLKPITKWLKNAAIDVMFVGSYLLQKIQGRTGTPNYASTIATILKKSEDYFAITATSQLDTERRQAFSKELQRISDFTTDQIVSITPAGQEEVFDIEVDRTENFIANGVVSHNTRWSKRDLTAQVLKAAAQRGGEEWEVIEFPAILPSGKPLWPEFWSLKELDALKQELSNSKWQAQYQQNPTSDSSALIKREWWRTWEYEDPPQCSFILMAWDTAYEKSSRSDYSACTTWGVFTEINGDGKEITNIILLNAIRDRVEFPELKRMVLSEYKEWKPDSVIIEKKASGAPLIYELRAMGIPVQEFTPTKGNDKVVRLNAVSDIFASGRVWAPNTSWAEEVMDEVASFPSGDHDDYVDTVSMALMRFRKGGFLTTDMDEEEPERKFRSRHATYY
jgi:predicted phage terminase large subunit-like protein